MNPFFKHVEGEIAEYSEMKKNALYKEPIYSSEDRACIGDEARKFVMYSDTDWLKVQKSIGNLGRTPVQVYISRVKILKKKGLFCINSVNINMMYNLYKYGV